jgi:hypothetical protein
MGRRGCDDCSVRASKQGDADGLGKALRRDPQPTRCLLTASSCPATATNPTPFVTDRRPHLGSCTAATSFMMRGHALSVSAAGSLKFGGAMTRCVWDS